MDVRRVADRARHRVRRPLSRTPYLWDLVMLVRPEKRATLARRDTALVMEGFLRSGNTFSAAAFAVANGPHLHVGRHLHGAPHLLRARRLGVPAVALIRRPRDAMLSYLVRRDTISPADALDEYLDFYRTAWPARDGFVVGLFETVVSDFGAVTDAVNARFGTSFVRYDPTPENEARAFALVEEMNRLECGGAVVETHVGRPSAERAEAKRDLERLLDTPAVRSRLAAADGIYQQYEERAATQLPR